MTERLIARFQRWAELSSAEEEALRTLPGEQVTFARGDHPLRSHHAAGSTMLMVDGWAAHYKDAISGNSPSADHDQPELPAPQPAVTEPPPPVMEPAPTERETL